MELLEAMERRNSVRSYSDKKITATVKESLLQAIADANAESGLHIQLVLDEPKAFDSFMAHYGKFSGVKNYIALIGEKGSTLDEKCGYYGEKITLLAQQLGLNTCWVALTYSKNKEVLTINTGEKLCLIIALGYGITQGVAHKSKTAEQVSKTDGSAPIWFQNGIHAVLLAPTAMNQQKFKFALKGTQVSAKAGVGFYNKVDLGIAKYHFEIGVGNVSFDWV